MNATSDFMGPPGAVSLAGLLIKNAIVLIDEIDTQIDNGKRHYAAPLLSDVSFLDMAVVIMFGLGFASALTLIVVPVLLCHLL